MIREIARMGRRVLNQVEREGYVIERYDAPPGQPIAAFRGKVVVGERTYPCDTAFSINTGDIPGGARAEFATLIHEGRQGKNVEHQRQVISNLSSDLPGKLVPDYRDSSYDVMYITSEPASKLDGDLAVDNIRHHAQVKATIEPHLEHLDQTLGLESHTQLSASERFGKDYMNAVRGLPSAPKTIYIPDQSRRKEGAQ